jgi:DNA-binding NtrC family response regulator
MAERKKMSVLVVDDDANWRPLMVTLLRNEFEVDSVATYEDAIRSILERKTPYHVVVTDIRYKDEEKENEDGLRLVEQLNRLGEYTKSVVITGYPSIDTAKRAIGRLAAFDYLEKYPASGDFGITEFQTTVRKAAKEAERQRPHGLVLPNLRILIIEPNGTWRKRLLEILKNSPYKIEVVTSFNDFSDKLERDPKEYQLVVFNEAIHKDSPGFFDLVQQRLPEAKKIMFTVQDVAEIIRLVQENAIQNVFTISRGEEGFDARDFQEAVHSAFAAEATKYVTIQILPLEADSNAQEVEKLSVGSTYLLALNLQNERQAGATPVWLAPRSEKRGRIRLETFIFAAESKLDPGTEGYWDIYLSQLPKPLMTEITAMKLGKLKISIELKQDKKWLGTITKEVDVVKT